MDNTKQTVDVLLSDNSVVKFEVNNLGREDVAFDARPITELCSTIEKLSEALLDPLKKIKPSKATIKFGLELSVESGRLTTLIVKGSSKANLEITLEWSESANK